MIMLVSSGSRLDGMSISGSVWSWDGRQSIRQSVSAVGPSPRAMQYRYKNETPLLSIGVEGEATPAAVSRTERPLRRQDALLVWCEVGADLGQRAKDNKWMGRRDERCNCI